MKKKKTSKHKAQKQIQTKYSLTILMRYPVNYNPTPRTNLSDYKDNVRY